MSTGTVSLETLIANVDELYALAALTECKIDVPISELQKTFARSFERNAPKIGAKFANLASRGRLDEALIMGVGLTFAFVGAGAIDFAQNKIAQQKAKDTLLPMYKEIAVKTQAIVLQLSEDNKKLAALLKEEKTRNVNHQYQIRALESKIEKCDAIVKRFMALQAKG